MFLVARATAPMLPCDLGRNSTNTKRSKRSTRSMLPHAAASIMPTKNLTPSPSGKTIVRRFSLTCRRAGHDAPQVERGEPGNNTNAGLEDDRLKPVPLTEGGECRNDTNASVFFCLLDRLFYLMLTLG